MLSFKFVETFFFLSLAITFALIITLVYQFKKRMENMEKKCDTMFDIVQNLAKEVLGFKQNNYEEQPIISPSHQMEQVAYDNLDVAVNTNANDDEESSGDESSGDESSGDESSGEESSGEESSDEGSDDDEEKRDTNVTNNLSNGKITIPDYHGISDVIAVDLSQPLTQLSSSPLDEYFVDESLDVSQFIDKDASKIEGLMNVDDTVDDTVDVNNTNDMDTEADDILGNNLSKSALRKLKLAELKRIATGKHIIVDDAMTKNAIIDIILTN
jgi:hypothetical protein